MYDYQFILRLLDRASRLNEQLEQSFERINQGDGGRNEKVDKILQSLLDHYHYHHPLPLIVETDVHGNITSANDEFIRVSKYSKDELIGENINILRSSAMEKGIFTDLWNHITAGEPWVGILQNRAKDYTTYWIHTLVCPVFDESGKVQKYWSFSFDITEQQHQREELSKTSDDVKESLRYAKRIQKTILPSKKLMDDVMSDYMLIYKPKEEVSGDFYWCNQVGNKNFIAVVDCTGHGVPGAFMSLIGYNLLNQIVIAQNIHDPGLILAELHRNVRSALKQDEEDSKSKDGMDVCLIVTHKDSNIIQYAGAFRPLFWWHNNELQIINGDKYSIGGEQLEEERTYTTHTLEVESNDALYLFSDGIVDQFGGPEKKKFSTKRLKNLLEQYHDEKMTIQRAKINLEWKDWIQDDEQTDDVTMIGLRIP